MAELSDPRWRELQDFVLLDEFGIVLRRYDAHVYSLEEELGMTVHAVIEGSFRSLTLNQHTGTVGRTTKDEETLLPDLKPVPADELETLELVQEGLKSDRNLIFHQAQDRIREAERILGAKPPIADDSPEYLKVVELVRDRVESYGAPIDKRTLDALARFGELRRSLATSEALPAFQSALDLYLLACRHSCFDGALGEEHRPPPIVGSFLPASEEDRKALRALIEKLGELEKELLIEAEGQENVDATRNAAAYRAAATHVSQARDRLTAGLVH
jgi:hypothetical protein